MSYTWANKMHYLDLLICPNFIGHNRKRAQSCKHVRNERILIKFLSIYRAFRTCIQNPTWSEQISRVGQVLHEFAVKGDLYYSPANSPTAAWNFFAGDGLCCLFFISVKSEETKVIHKVKNIQILNHQKKLFWRWHSLIIITASQIWNLHD